MVESLADYLKTRFPCYPRCPGCDRPPLKTSVAFQNHLLFKHPTLFWNKCVPMSASWLKVAFAESLKKAEK